MSRKLYKIENLKYNFPVPGKSGMSEPVLDIPRLSIEKGSVTVFRGHNGSGKTTMLKLLNGLLVPSAGKIISGSPSVLVQQEPYLFHGTVFQNLFSPLRFHGRKVRNRTEYISEVLKLVGLQGFEKRKARDLSGGEKKRVAIARALMTDPEVLLLDEPDANVDAETSKELENLIRTLCSRGMSVVLCSHNRGFAYRTADIIIDLYRGKIVDHHENIYRGSYEHKERLHSFFGLKGHTISCPSRTGHYSTAVISSKDVFVTEKELTEDISNQLKGVLLSVEPCKEDRVILTIDCGILIKSQIPASAFSLINVSMGDKLTAVFNPSAVHLY